MNAGFSSYIFTLMLSTLPATALLPLLLGFLIVTWVVINRDWRSNKYPLPPGPPGDPIIGHLRLIPAQKQEETFHRWAEIYGALFHAEKFPE